MLLVLIILTFLLGFTACVLAMVSVNSAVPAIGEPISETMSSSQSMRSR